MAWTMKAGDSKFLHLTIVDKAGAAVDLTEATSIRFWASRGDAAKFSRTPTFQKSMGSGIEEVALLDGLCLVRIDPADTRDLNGSYYCEVEVVDAFGNVATPISDTFTVKKDLIR